MTRVYEELVDFIAAGSTSTQVARFTPSKKTRERVWNLLARAKEGTLSSTERDDLEHYLQIEHIMRLAKAKARLRASHE
jgi:hypothetical protein